MTASAHVILNKGLEARAAEMAEVAGFLWERGWAEFIGGNISVNVTELARELPEPPSSLEHIPLRRAYPGLAGASFLVTATLTRMRDVAVDWRKWLCLVRLDDKGAGYYLPWRGGEELRPTSEFNSHLAIHHTNAEIGRDARAVVHTHPTEIIAMTHLPQFNSAEAMNKVLWSMMPEAVFTFPDGVGFAPYAMTGTDALEEETVKVLRGHRVCVWEKHGCLAVGKDVHDAFDVLDTVNKCARLYFLCKHAGSDPEGIPEEEIEAIRRAFVKES